MTKSSYTAAGQALQQQHANSPAEQLKRQKAYLDARLPMLAKWVRGGVRPEALLRFALLDLQQNEKLRQADPQSIYLALLACAITSLEPGALKGECYLVPFSGKAQWMVGYRGLLKLARRTGSIAGLVANVVRERDIFDLDLGTANSITHKPQLEGDRGDIIGAYGIATMTNGHRELEYMDRDSLNRIRDVADKRGKSPAWANWPDEQSRKSVIRRLCKRLPLHDDFAVANAIEARIEETGAATDVLDLETDGEASRIASAPSPTVEQKTVGEVDSFDSSDIRDEDK